MGAPNDGGLTMTKRLGMAVGLAMVASWTGAAWAGPVAQCLRDARSTLKTCRDACTSAVAGEAGAAD